MSQEDYNVANADGATVRADINAQLGAIATNNSGPTAPTTTFANMWWYDTATNDLNQRNEANTAWVLVARKDPTTGWIPYRQGLLLNSTVLVKTAGYTVVVADNGKLIDADASSTAFSVVLPTVASAGNGFLITIKKTDSSVNKVTVDGNGAETIDGATVRILARQFDAIMLLCDGVEWHIVADSKRSSLNGACRLTKSGANLLLSRHSGTTVNIDGAFEVIPAGGVMAATGQPSAISASQSGRCRRS